MVATETFVKAADTMIKPVQKDYRHYFNGANYLLYYLGSQAAQIAGDKEQSVRLMNQYDMAVKRLQQAAELEIEPVYRKGVLAEVRVRVKNMRAGHNLPTSLTNSGLNSYQFIMSGNGSMKIVPFFLRPTGSAANLFIESILLNLFLTHSVYLFIYRINRYVIQKNYIRL